MRSLVSVVIPSFNRPQFLRHTVESILAQTHPPAEILVIDDGSTEDPAPALCHLGPTVHLHRQPNLGICAARNTGVRLATCPWIAFCDNDDLWRPDKLEQQMRLHAAHPDVLYSFTNFRHIRNDFWAEETKFDRLPPDFFADALTTPNGDRILKHSLVNALLSSQPIFPSTVVISRSLLDQIGGFRDELGRTPSEDLEFTLRCVRHPPIGVLTQPLVGIRKHAGNHSFDIPRQLAGEIAILRLALNQHALPDTTRTLIEQSIVHRSLLGANAAFSHRRFDLAQQFLADVPRHQLPKRLRLKQAIAHLPNPLANRLTTLLVKPT